jgi:uncharacterized coiled-coil protein SlyX
VTHLERTIQELNGVILAQQQRMDSLDQRFARLTVDLDAAMDEAREPRRLEDEKPPHY